MSVRAGAESAASPTAVSPKEVIAGLTLSKAMLERCAFPPAGTPLCCAVSGGPDSLALLVLGVVARCAVTAVHVDHGLRPGSSDEAAVVADAAARLGAQFRAERISIPDGPNLEARARTARFSVLAPGVATGHTMDDQAETVLVNLLRGAGPDGVAGIRPGPQHPILGLRRAETREVCEEAGLVWLEDPSNDDPRYVRNRVRHELLPLCASIAGRDPVPLLARMAELEAVDSAFLDELAGMAVEDPADARALTAAPAALARRAVRRWLRASGATSPAGGRSAADRVADRHPPSLADVRKVLEVAAGAVAATELAGGWRVRRSKGRLVAESPRSLTSCE